ncbi:MAG TPA: hypothetical protein VHJ78_01985 [Actinomycetota bacterium]|nr:hypothetical protein [Actinomycetota bacterium]
MDEAQASARLAEMAQLPLPERADALDVLLDDLEAALDETSTELDDPGT